MKCIECDNEAVILVVDSREDFKTLRTLCRARPGMIIPMNYPESLRGYCDDHWVKPGTKVEVI